MPELITKDNSPMSAKNFMKLVKRVLSDCILDGCSITKSGDTINITAGFIVAGGALVEIQPTSINVSSSGELVLRIDLDAENQAQILARQTTTLTQQNITTEGRIYEMRLASYVFESGSIKNLTVTASGSSSSSGSTSSGSGSTTGGGTSSENASAGGTLVSKVSSTASTPTVHYSASYQATKNNGTLNVSLTFEAWLNSSGSKLGTGSKLTIYARLNGGSWKPTVIKKTSDSWSGATHHSASLSLSGTTDSTQVTVDFYVTRDGSTYSGSAGTLGSAGSPKSYNFTIM